MRHVLALPSWVIPGSIAENACFLAEKKQTGVREIGLCLFESAACLTYGNTELPQDLNALGFSWHAHLPFDLFEKGPDQAAAIATELMRKVAFLDVRRAVLHPPAKAQDLERFARTWEQAGQNMADLLLENTSDAPLPLVSELAQQTGCGLCLDIGHAFAESRHGGKAGPKFAQTLEHVACRARIVHMNAPEPARSTSGKHYPLTTFNSQEKDLVRQALAALQPECVIMLELFSWPDIELSLPVLRELLE